MQVGHEQSGSSGPVSDAILPALDAERLLECWGSDPNLFPELVAEFLRTMDSRTAAIRSALDTRDAQRAHFELHRLKGTSLMLGGRALGSLFAEMEAMAADGDLSRIPEGLSRVPTETERFRASIESFRPGKAA